MSSISISLASGSLLFGMVAVLFTFVPPGVVNVITSAILSAVADDFVPSASSCAYAFVKASVANFLYSGVVVSIFGFFLSASIVLMTRSTGLSLIILFISLASASEGLSPKTRPVPIPPRPTAVVPLGILFVNSLPVNLNASAVCGAFFAKVLCDPKILVPLETNGVPKARLPIPMAVWPMSPSLTPSIISPTPSPPSNTPVPASSDPDVPGNLFVPLAIRP